MNFGTAKMMADMFVQQLQPFVEKIHIAGSIRRQCPEVGDIEIICLPKKVKSNTDLFGDGDLVIHPGFVEAVKSITVRRIKGLPEGRYTQIIVIGNTGVEMKLDLFMPQADDYYRIYAMRTGSAAYSHHRIAGAWTRKGWCGVPNIGLRLIKDCSHTASGWVLINKDGEKPPVWRSETEFFSWLGIPFLNPCDREINQQTLTS